MQGVIHVQKIKNKGGGALVNALPLSSSSPCSYNIALSGAIYTYTLRDAQLT